MLCPRCGGHTYRSHTRGFNEKLVKTLTSYKTYRCHDCDWRGWLRKIEASERRCHWLRTIIGVLVTLLITTLLALYVVDKLNAPPSVDSSEQQTS